MYILCSIISMKKNKYCLRCISLFCDLRKAFDSNIGFIDKQERGLFFYKGNLKFSLRYDNPHGSILVQYIQYWVPSLKLNQYLLLLKYYGVLSVIMLHTLYDCFSKALFIVNIYSINHTAYEFTSVESQDVIRPLGNFFCCVPTLPIFCCVPTLPIVAKITKGGGGRGMAVYIMRKVANFYSL